MSDEDPQPAAPAEDPGNKLVEITGPGGRQFVKTRDLPMYIGNGYTEIITDE